MSKTRAELQAYILLGKHSGRKPTKKEIEDFLQKWTPESIDEMLNPEDDDWP